MGLQIVPFPENRAVRWRRNGAPTNGGGADSQPVFALAVSFTEDIGRKPRTWAVNGYGEWLPIGHGDDEGRLT